MDFSCTPWQWKHWSYAFGLVKWGQALGQTSNAALHKSTCELEGSYKPTPRILCKISHSMLEQEAPPGKAPSMIISMIGIIAFFGLVAW